MPGKETDLVRAILAYLKVRGILAWRNNTGGARFQNKPGGKEYHVRYGIKGQADITGILEGGWRLEIECKVKPGKVTVDQQIFLSAIRERGGCAILAYTLDDVIEHLKSWDGRNDA